MTNASRAQVDLDALAHDLRREGRAPQKGDPLAELARIVGQDDPFRALLAARGGEGAADAAAQHPSAQQQPAWTGRIEPSFAAEAAPKPTPADAFDQYLASVEQDTHAEAAREAEGAQDAPAAEYEEGRALRRARPRRRLASVGAGIGVVAVAIAGALTYKGLHRVGGGGVPVVQADTTPLKVAPKVADGVEIPDQNRQIYDAKGRAKDGQIRIVNREEQPLDVAEAARAAQGPGPAGGQGAASGGTTPGSGPFEAFGEPRRVRTIAVKPDAPPAQPQRDAEAASPVPTMTLPADDAPKAKPARQSTAQVPAAQIPAAQAPAQPAATTAQVQAPPPAVPAQPPAAKPVAVKPPPKAAQRVASVAPEATPAQTAADAPDTTAATGAGPAASDAPVGGFSVQLGVRGSAADARAALREMQAKHGRLAGKPELIRQAEVKGKTIYRVRVGPLAKAEAASLCSALQGEGGQCFVAKN